MIGTRKSSSERKRGEKCAGKMKKGGGPHHPPQMIKAYQPMVQHPSPQRRPGEVGGCEEQGEDDGCEEEDEDGGCEEQGDLRGLILQWQGAGTMIGKKEKRKLS